MLHVLEMGPRRRRQLIAAGLAVAMLAGIALGVVLLIGPRRSGRDSSGGPASAHFHYVPYSIRYMPGADAQYNTHSGHLVFGLTKHQLRRLVGPPTKIVGNCWQYQVNAVYSDGYVEDADRLCFAYGHYTQKFVQGAGGVWKAF